MQAVEAKEGVPIQQETLPTASITFQVFFKCVPPTRQLSSCTGTVCLSLHQPPHTQTHSSIRRGKPTARQKGGTTPAVADQARGVACPHAGSTRSWRA